MTRLSTALLSFAFAPLLACTPTTTLDAGPDAGEDALINPTDAGSSDGGMPPVPTGDCPTEAPFLAHLDVGGGVTETTVTACSDARWVGIDLESKQEILVEDATATDAWDLAFQRFHVKSNGGVSGAAGVRVAPLTGVEFEDVNEAPSEGWLQDLPDSDLDGHDDYVISGQDLSWWEYDLETHVINMTGVVWVVETDEGHHYKLELIDYYEDVAGSAESGYPTFVWAELGADDDAGAADGGSTDAGADDAGDGAGGMDASVSDAG